MKIKLKENSSVEILGSNGNTIVTVNENDNVSVKKDLDVIGATKLNNGFIPIYSYNDAAGNTFNIYSEIESGDGYTFLGDLNSTNIGIGYYTIDNSDNIDIINFLQVGSDGLSVYIGQDNYEKFINIYELIDELNKKQNKLYRHRITLRAASSADGTCMLEYISPSNLVCDSLEDLRTVLGNPQMNSYVASNPSGDLFGVVISPSTAQLKKVGTEALTNITTVSDTVTPL